MDKIPFLDSGVIRGLLLALVSLAGLIARQLGIEFAEDFWNQLTDQLLVVLATAGSAWAMWARATKPTPPLTDMAIEATKERDIEEALRRSEGGYARPAVLAATAVLGLLMASCSIFGGVGPKSFNDRLAVGYVTVTSVRDTGAALVRADLITPDDAQNIQAQADNARAALDIARTIHVEDPKAADAKLRAALQVLGALETYLRSKQ